MMKKFKRFVAAVIATLFSLSITFVPSASAISADDRISQWLTATEATEIVEINGITYTYTRILRDGKRITTITNNANDNIEEIVFDINSRSIFYDGNKVVQLPISTINLASEQGVRATWQTISSDSVYLSWGTTATAAAVAEMIATALSAMAGVAGHITASIVIQTLGSAFSSTISSCTGGTVSCDLQMLIVPGSLNQYRYIWSFTAANGDRYGPYISNVYF